MNRLALAAAIVSLSAAIPAGAAPADSVAAVRSTEGRLDIRLGRLPAGAREWEAFLSLDGGRSFPLRITPHLDVAVGFYSWSVPGLLGDDARIRLRFGDERREIQVDLPESVRLAPALHSRLLLPKSGDIGKKPFPGEEGLSGWVEGTPDGGNLRFVSPPSGGGLDSAVSRGLGTRPEAIVERRGPELPRPDHSAWRVARMPAELRSAGASDSRTVPPLQRTSRLNI